MKRYQLTGFAVAIQYSGTPENIADIEANLGPVETVWVGAAKVAGVVVAGGQWLARFEDTGAVKVYSDEAFRLRFVEVA